MASSFVYYQTAVFVFMLFLPATAVVASPGNETDLVALLAFKSRIKHDPWGVLSSWNQSNIDFCRWEGITCSRRHRRVSILNLRSKGLVGSLSPYIGNLSFLREIRLANNTFQGEIPKEIGRLFRLRFLHLGNNSLVGQLPANLSHCSKLSSLLVGWNNLVGKLPYEFASLSSLKELAIHRNKLTGGIPPFLANISSLEALSASYNALGGSIPDSLSQLRLLTALGLGGNNISGTIPVSLYNISSLVVISLSENRLQGSLPSNLGLKLPNLEQFQVSANFFTGPIPVSLSNASKLGFIEMARNNFSGKVSVDFGGMKQLVELNLGGNSLGSGEADELRFINSLANCSALQALTLAINRFQGILPHSFGNLSTQLRKLIIDRNRFYGSIPSGIANFVNLYLLGLERNQFSGKIPKEIGELRNLQWMDLHSNQLSEEIPPSLGNMSSLLELRLHDNNLQGTIPASLGMLRSLAALDLSRNKLSGNIPETMYNISPRMISINLYQNHLVGGISESIGNMKNLMKLDVSNNNLSGEIPVALSNCGNLERLYMEGNLLQGLVPQALSSLRAIQVMDLSRNNLSGQIPKFLESIPALKYLNLSFNDFEGEVPVKGVFSNASAISIVGNERLCGGILELRLPQCNSKKQKDRVLVKVMISTSCALLGIALLAFVMFYCVKRRREKQSSGPILSKSLLRLSYESLLKATGGFSSTNLIGVGSFGSVYKGVLDDQDGVTTIAVKVLNLRRQGASKSFMTECRALKNIRHRNLVKIITSCSSVDFQGNDFKALVYEFMPNGSLENWLHPTSVGGERVEIPSLSLLERIEIGIDVGNALDYLHHHCEHPILHCDLKPSNILLDSNMTAHVGDFGLVKFLQQHSNPTQSSSLAIRGTIGYTAPEYGLGSVASADGDVYSYGILLLEMMTAKRPTDEMFEGGLNLHKFSWIALQNKGMHIVDPTLLINIDGEVVAENYWLEQAKADRIKECLVSVVRIGVACSMESPQERMEISKAVHELQLIKEAILGCQTDRYIH